MSDDPEDPRSDPGEDDIRKPSQAYQDAHGWKDGKPPPYSNGEDHDPPNGKAFNPEDWLAITDEPWDRDTIPARPWIATPYLMREEITLLHGPGGAGKSQLTIAWAVALALGRPFGRLMPSQRYRVLLANFEDGKLEQMRRISAMLEWFGAMETDLKGYLFRVSLGPQGGDATMFGVGERDSVIRTTYVWDALVRFCEVLRPDVVMGDPLIAISAVPENDNQLIRRVMATLKIGLTQKFGCSLALAHHDVKSGGDDEDSDQTNARGAGDIVNAARFELAVKKMTTDQAGQMNVDPNRRGLHFRLGSAASKLNYFEPMDAEWFRRFERPIGIGGQQTVYCEPWDPASNTLDAEQTDTLVTAIGNGTRHGPYSPKLSEDDARSLVPLLRQLGLATILAQRRLLRDLKRAGRVLVGKYRRPGHGTHLRAGLRTENGDPLNYEWQDAELDA